MVAALVLLGSAILLATIVDVVWTTFAAGSGAGPLTGRIADRLWRGAVALHHRRPGHRALSAAGVAVAGSVLVWWIVAVLVGWTLIFGFAEGAVREPPVGEPASFVGRVYFVGFSVFTLGLGDLEPGDGAWRLATAAMSGMGLVMVTLAITFLLPVASAVTARRQLAGYVTALGPSPGGILARAWNGEDFGSFDQHLAALTPMVVAVRQQQLAYPVVHYFHSVDRQMSLAPSIAELVGALHLLDVVDPSVRPGPAVVRPLLAAIDGLLPSDHPAEVAPIDPPDVTPLREAGIPLVDPPAATDEVVRRRQALSVLLHDDGW